MGPNGSGKSTLARVLAGHPAYEVTGGQVTFNGKDLLDLEPEERACEGVFMAFQYPVEIAGVNNSYFLKAALNAQRKHRGEPELDAMEFLELVQDRLTGAAHRQRPDAAARQRGLLGRREEAQRDLPDARAAADAGHPRRDGFRARHRRAEDRRRRRQRDAVARPRHRRRHALPAAARTTSCPTSCTCSATAAS